MTQPFDYFVVFAEMRTGSNFLEANINAFDGLTCYGEAFNPAFIGYPNKDDILGVTQAQRDADPERLLGMIRKATHGLGGFRFFHNHDPRILPQILNDPRCAKVILTRNPIDSYVSWKIARATDQWKLTNVKKRKDGKAHFDADEFEAHLDALQSFQIALMHALQVTGQTAFYVAYEDLHDLDVMNGLAAFLGIEHRLEALDKSLKRQNPQPISEKVENFDDVEKALARLDRFNLSRTPNFEPRRGPVVPNYWAAPRTGLLYLPIPSGVQDVVLRWMAALDGTGIDELHTRFNQKTLRQWMRNHPGHRRFAVLRHPVTRAHAVFCNHILTLQPGSLRNIRNKLRRHHNLPIPEDEPGQAYSLEQHREAFKVFLKFVKANLDGQTAIRVDGNWATQAACLQGMADFALPDILVREDEMPVFLPALAMQAGHPGPDEPGEFAPETPYALDKVYDEEIEQLARDAYMRDYLMFGFSDWR